MIKRIIISNTLSNGINITENTTFQSTSVVNSQASIFKNININTELMAKHCPKPEYPETSRRLNEEGTVILRVNINEAGIVVDSWIQESSGFSRLDNSAIESAGKCRFISNEYKSTSSLKYTFKLQ